MNHNKYMRIALELAEKGRGFTSPNPMVGSIVVNKNKIVGKGYHKKAGSHHAEIEAIKQAGKQAKGSVLYVTLEPCNHTGKTPPCTMEIIKSGIKHVVFAMKDPNPNIKGNGDKFLEQHGIKITSGVYEEKAKKMNEYFIKYIKTGLPFVTVKCAATMDGRIATRTGDAKWITGLKAREYVHKIRHSVDAIMVGKNTILIDDPSLTTRLSNKRGVDPARLILDTNLSISENSKIITQYSNAQTYIITGQEIDETKKLSFEKLGIQVLPLLKKNNKLNNMVNVLEVLGSMNFTSLLVEGGGEVINSVLSCKIVDKVCFFYAPKIMTGNDGVPMCKGFGPNKINNCIDLQDISIRTLGKDLLFQAYIQN